MCFLLVHWRKLQKVHLSFKMHRRTSTAAPCFMSLCATHLFDEVSGIDCQVRRQVEFTLQDLIDGLLPVFRRERRLKTEYGSQSAVTNKTLKLLVNRFCGHRSHSIPA